MNLATLDSFCKWSHQYLSFCDWLACLLWEKPGARLWAMLWRSPHGKKTMSLASEDLWPASSHMSGLGSGSGGLPELEVRPPLVKPRDDYSPRQPLIVAWWETWSQEWTIPWFPSPVSSQPAWYMAPSILAVLLKLHFNIIQPLSGCRVELIFHPAPCLAILRTFSMGKTCSQKES